jgi:hypothetical protein
MKMKLFRVKESCTVTITERTGIADYEATVSDEEVKLIADVFRNFPPELLSNLREWVRMMIMEVSIADREAEGTCTQKQLLKQFKALLRGIGDQVPSISEQLFVALKSTERHRRLEATFGRVRSVKNQEQYEEYVRMVREAVTRVQRALSNPAELKHLLEENIAYVERRPEFTREWYAAKRAFKLLENIVIGKALSFYEDVLGRADRGIDDTLVAFADKLLQLFLIKGSAGYTPIKKSPAAIRRMLYREKGSRIGGNRSSR